MAILASPAPSPFFLQNTREFLKVRCASEGRRNISASASAQVTIEESETFCTICKAKGWLVCDFCQGQKVNVQVKNSRMYRRCPSCKAAGVVLCPKCKVYKCVTFPDGQDGGFEM